MIDFSEDIDINKTSVSKDCNKCHYWCFLYKNFKFQSFVWDGFHQVLKVSTDINSIAILNIHGLDYHCNIIGISKSKVINLFLRMLI